MKVTLEDYLEYTLYNRDDSPLYLFESAFDKHPIACDLMKDYSEPKFFRKNYFTELLGNLSPPHRWFLIGPRRSGSVVH